MAKITSVLQERLKKKQNIEKITALARRSSHGNLSSFEGIFSSSQLSKEEKETLENLLKRYRNKTCKPEKDFKMLSELTTEIKAITKQAILLHGERIQKAQVVLKKYKEGAFSTWLVATYGNRQTPYNLLQYFEFFKKLSTQLQEKLELIPKQAIYTLASRNGCLKEKIDLIKSYNGETKDQLLELIRAKFPLTSNDKRIGVHRALQQARGILQTLNHPDMYPMSTPQAKETTLLLKECLSLITSQRTRS
jgi:hypothetical protein